jgi:hypothetical protein
MQKVEGSSPFIALTKARISGPFASFREVFLRGIEPRGGSFRDGARSRGVASRLREALLRPPASIP